MSAPVLPSTTPSPDFGALSEAIPTPLLVIAPPDWTIVAANEARLQVTGTTREQQIGRPLFDVFPVTRTILPQTACATSPRP